MKKSRELVYIKLIIAITILWMFVTTFYIVDLYRKVGRIEHILVHTSCVH